VPGLTAASLPRFPPAPLAKTAAASISRVYWRAVSGCLLAAFPHRVDMRIGAVLLLLLGVALATALVLYYGFGAVAAAILSMGWGLAVIVGLHVLPVVVAAFAWSALLGRRWSPRPTVVVVQRWIREAINNLLPLARLGGDVVAVRLLVLWGGRVHLASASMVADRTVEVFTQVVLAFAGVALLWGGEQDPHLARLLIMGLLVLLVCVVAFVIAQHRGLLRLLEKALIRLGNVSSAAGGALSAERVAGIHDAVWAIYGARRRVALAALLHTLSWLLGAAETWLALRFMGHPVSAADAFILEALAQAVASAGFFLPASLGAQEAGYMVVGTMLGVPAQAGLALSLVKRGSDIALGLPGLLAWQAIEGKRLWLRWAAKRRATSC
jgi:putative membrane protein